MIRAIIVDDEPNCLDVLATLLERYCPEVTVVAACPSAEEALAVIAKDNVQLLFLDIEMPHMNGFELLQQIPRQDIQVIFTTSYDQYALKAIRFSALDYLLKPVDHEELQQAVRKASQRAVRSFQTTDNALPQQLEILLQKLNAPSRQIDRIALPTMEGLQLLPVDFIISCASSSNYTIISLKDNQRLVVSRTLKEIEEMLSDYSFLRVHHSYLVNLNETRKYIKGEGGQLIMSDGSSVDVSRSRKDELLKKLQGSR